ncbi:hypothetical protein LCGC14_2332290 [marine sediment metagenome]|uniref:Phage portal protein n=1 Tax=marine sediment metagenome TaxID=412755 RepID=A0A0F9CFB0_9ZZZZ
MDIKQRFYEAARVLFKGISTSQELADFLLAGQGRMSKSGISVSPETAMTVSTVYCCVRVIAENVAQLPIKVYEFGPDGRTKTRLPDHPLSRLLKRPNFWQTPFEFWEMMLGHVVLRGNAYALKNIVRGQTKELIPIHPNRIEVVQTPELKLIYKFTDKNGKLHELPMERVFHLRGLSWNGFTGVSPIALARESIGLALATEQHGSALFKNGAQPGAILRYPGTLKDDARANLKKSWTERFTGENAFSLALIEEGMEWESVGMSSEDAQFIETRKFQAVDITRWFKVPPHKVGILDRATFSNIEQQSIDFIIDTLMPWTVRTQQAIMRDLLLPSERQRVFVEFLMEGLLRGDSKARSEFYKKAITNGWMTRNEVREKESLDPIEGLDEILVPMNMVSNDEEEEDEKSEDESVVPNPEQSGNGAS